MIEQGPMLILRGSQSLLSFYGAVYLCTAIGAPSWFLRNMSLENYKGFRFGAMAFLSLFGLGLLIFSAAHALIAAVPYSVGTYDEDGDWQPLRDGLQGMIALLGTLGIAGWIEKNAALIVLSPIERKARRALAQAIYENRNYPANIERAAHRRITNDLGADQHEGSSWATEARNEIRNEILSRIRADRQTD